MCARKLVTIFLCCFATWSHIVFAADDRDENVSSAARQALILAFENEERVVFMDRARFQQSIVLDEAKYVVEFGWNGERQFQKERDRGHRVYDGENTSTLVTAGSPARTPSLTISKEIHDALHGWPEWNLNAMFPLRQHWWAREDEGGPPSQWESSGSQVIDGVDCFVYSGIGTTFDNRPQAKRVWMDASGRVRRLEEYMGSFNLKTPPAEAIKNGDIYRRITYLEYRRYGEVNVPTLLKLEGFGEYLVHSITTEQFEIQPEFTANTFVLNIPIGTEVYDASAEPPESYTYPAERMTEADLEERRVQLAQDLAEQRQSEEAQETLIGTNAPELSIDKWLNGDTYSLEDLKGNWVLLDFGAITCGPCLSVIPYLNDAIEEFKHEPIRIVSVHSYVPAGLYPAIEEYISKHKIEYAVGVSSKDSNNPWGKMFSDYSVHSIPQAALIDPNGQIHSFEEVWEALARLRKEIY